jgi:hypothetical protein
MSAEMKASVLLTLKDELTGKAKGAANALKDLGASAKALGGTTGLGAAAKDAQTLAGAASKATVATRETASAASSIGSGFASAAKQADALASAANRAASASTKASAAAAKVGGAGGKDTILYGPAGASERAAKTAGGVMPVKGNDFQKAAAIANNLERANPSLYAGPKGAALLEQHVGEHLEHAKASGKSLGGKAMDAYFTLAIGQMAVGALDHVVSQAGDVTAMREKIMWALGGDKKGADAAHAKAVDLSGKYKNTSVLENLHIIDDLRANLPESMEHILHDAADPFIKMHSFFKAWEGGKHAGKAEAALKDVGFAIRSGELLGISSSEDLIKHTQAVATGKILFGAKFRVAEYFQASQKAATALSAADDTYKYIDFPILMQRLSQGAGVALATGFTKYVGGGTVSQQTAENWRSLDMVDMSKVQLDKGGKIKASSLLGTTWLKDGDAFAKNFNDATMEKLVPKLAMKEGLGGLKGLDAAWKAKDVDKVSHILNEFRKDQHAMAKLAQASIALAKDRNAAKLIEEAIVGAPADLRDRERALKISKDTEKYESYDKAKQELSAQTDRLLQIASGEDLSGNITKAVSGVASFMTAMGDGLLKLKAAVKTNGAWLGEAQSNPGLTSAKPAALEFWDWMTGKGGSKPGAAPGSDGPMGPPVPNHVRFGGRYQDDPSDRNEIATGPAVPTLVGANMAAGADGQAPAGVTIQANGPQVSFNQAPPNVTVNVNVQTNASPHEIGAAVGASVSGAMNNSGALHDGAY